MKVRFFLVAAATFLTSTALHAQYGALYVNPIASRISNSTADTGTFAFLGQNVTSRIFWGVNFGGYYDVKRSDKFALGGDVRDSILHGNNAGLNNFLVGLRISRPAPERLRPYVEPFVGAGTSRAPETTIHVTKARVRHLRRPRLRARPPRRLPGLRGRLRHPSPPPAAKPSAAAAGPAAPIPAPLSSTFQ